MWKRARRHFTRKFEAHAVEFARASAGTKSLGHIAKNLDLTEKALRGWVKKAEKPAANDPEAAATTSSEQQEIARLEGDWQQVKIKRDFLKQAAAFFANETS